MNLARSCTLDDKCNHLHEYVLPNRERVNIRFDHGDVVGPTTTFQMRGGEVVTATHADVDYAIWSGTSRFRAALSAITSILDAVESARLEDNVDIDADELIAGIRKQLRNAWGL